jgi:chondroitin AC lyase
VTGTEYFPITPVYDWQKIPGTTGLQQPALPPEGEIQKQGLTDFVGAVTDGQYGAVGFDFISPHSLVKARKSWFFFDTEYVCLGAGISSTSKQPVVTTLNQCKLNGEVIVQSEGKEQTLSKGEHPFSHANWLYHDGTGYIFPEPAQVVLSNQVQTGNWYSINRQVVSSRKNISMDVFKLWIDHGASANNATYQYIVMPATTKDATRAAGASPCVEIVSNTPALQAVWHRDLKILQAVFYKNGEISLSSGLKINMEGPGIVMIKTEDKSVGEISVADPLRKLSKIRFSINRKLTVDADNVHAVWNEVEGISEIVVELPQGIFAGKSVTVYLNQLEKRKQKMNF